MRKCVLPAMLLGGLTSCGDIPTVTSALSVPAQAAARDVGHVYIPGRYIVRFKPGTGTSASLQGAALSSMYGGVVDRVYTSAINGASIQLTDAAATALRNDARVLSVEQDEVITKHWVQSNPTWGLDRIDQRTRPLSNSYSYLANGGGVTVYILDSGINYGQADFGGRASFGTDAITIGGDGSDCDGHGSHVAGTVGSATYGVAKNVKLVSVRVLDCQGNGTSSSVLAGIDWVTNHRVLPAVANMSLGGATNSTVNFAVESSIASGVTYVVSAGNYSVDACGQSPASAPNVITVGATDAGDAFAGYSNYGNCVDILAPGTSITSWWTGSGNNTISGTSMSTPHVTGAAALYLQTNPSATPAQVRAALLGNATPNVVTGVPAATPNLLLYTGFVQAAPPPVALFTSTCTSTACAFDASGSTSAWGQAATYAWSFGDGSGSTLQSPSHTYAAVGAYTVSLTITDPNGTNTKTATISLNRAPTATITTPASNTVVTSGSNALFSGSATDPEDGTLSGTALVWRSDVDGVIGSGASISTATLSAGSHVITLTATDAMGATAIASVTVIVNRPPAAAITLPASSITFSSGTPVSFAGSALDPEDGVLAGSALSWSSSRDGVIGAGTTFTSTTLSVGTHVVTLTATDSRGASATISRTISITQVNQAPVARFTWSCPTLQCTMDASSSSDDAGIVRYTWAWGDGRSESKVQPLAKNTWAATNTYTISLTVTDAGGLTNTVTRQVSIPNSAPVASIAGPAPNGTFTQGAAITFTGSASDIEDGPLAGTALTWSSSINGVLGTGSSVSTTALSPGLHVITLTARDGLGATGTSAVSVFINQAPTPAITSPSASSAFVQGSSITFAGSAMDPEDGALNGSSLTWTSSIDGAIGTGTTFALSTLSLGTHVVTLTARDANNVTASTTVGLTIVPNQPPVASISAPAANTSFGAGASITFTGSAADPEDGPLGGAALTWTSNIDGPLGTGASLTTSTLRAGTHVITLAAVDSRNAIGSATLTIVVTPVVVNQAPVARFTWSCPTLQCTMDASTSSDDVGVVRYTWAWGDGRTESKTQPVAKNTWSAANTYAVTLTVTDAAGLTNSVTRQVPIPTQAPVNQVPTAAITSPATGSVYTLGSPVSLAGMGTDAEDGALAGSSLAWSSSIDGALGTGATLTTSALSAGTHVVTLTARDAQGATATATLTIVINRPPTANISSPSTGASFTQGRSVTFVAIASDAEDGALSGASLAWTSSRDGQLGIGTTLSTSALSIGAHTITLAATDSRGVTTTTSIAITISANQAPVASITSPATGSVVLSGTTVTMNGAGNDAEDGALTGTSLAWTSNLDGAIGTGASVTALLSPGVHIITLTARDAMNVTGSTTITLTINRPPTAAISSPANNALVAVGTPVSLVGSGNDPETGTLAGTALTWTSSLDGVIGTGTTVSTSALRAGVHTITLTARDGFNATASASITLTVGANQPPVATILTPLVNSSFSSGSSVTFSGTGVDAEDGMLAGSSLVWTSSINGQIGTGTSFSTSALSPGGHVITLTVRDSANATSVVTRSIIIRPRFGGP